MAPDDRDARSRNLSPAKSRLEIEENSFNADLKVRSTEGIYCSNLKPHY